MQTIDRARERGILLLRLLMGVVFGWAGAEKILQVGGESFSAKGFLTYGTAGTWPGLAEDVVANPTQAFWVSLTESPTLMSFIDVIVPYGQLAIGVALILGLATRFASAMGVLMMGLFFVAAWDFGFGIVNQHFVYAVATGVVGYASAGEVLGLDRLIERLSFVRRMPALRFVLR